MAEDEIEALDDEDEYEEPRVQVILTHSLVALADLDDEATVRAHRWQAHRPTPSGTWYARTSIEGRHVYMHDLLMKTQDGMTVEHVNGDGLDDRRANLRLAKDRPRASRKQEVRGHR
jgi:hypothetical protein